jgi:hypothetical protein
MKCRNSAFNAQGSKVIIVAVRTGRSSENIVKQQWRRSGKRRVRVKLSLSQKLMVF